MPIALVQSTQAAVTGSTTSPIVFGSNNTAGDFLVVCGRGNTVAAGAPTVNDTAGNVWTILQITNPGLGTYVFLAVVANCLAGANTVQIHSGSANNFAAASFIIAEYSGVARSYPLNAVSAIATGTGQTSQAGTPVTTTRPLDLVLFFGANETVGPLTPVTFGGGFSLVQDSTTNAFLGHILNAATGTYSPTFTGAASSTWETYTDALFLQGNQPGGNLTTIVSGMGTGAMYGMTNALVRQV